MIPWDLVYDFPLGVWALAGLFPILLGYIFLYYHRKHVLQTYTGDDSDRLTLFKRSLFIYWFKTVFICLVWITATVALMQPKGNGRYAKEASSQKEFSRQQNEKRYKNHSIVFLIDTSASMGIKDARGEKTRLESAQDIADQISSELTGQTVSLYAFTSDTTKMSPPSMDYFFLRLMLQQLQINEGDVPGTDILQALKTLHTLLFTRHPSELKTLILISDGGDTVFETLQNKERESFVTQTATVFSDAEKTNLRIFTIGTGSTTNHPVPGVLFEGRTVQSKLEEELLQHIAEKARGKYYRANAYSALDISRDLLLELSVDNPYREESSDSLEDPKEALIYSLYFQVPLGITILLLAFTLLCPEGNLKKMFSKIGIAALYLIVFPLHAGTDNLSHAALFFEAEDYPRAISLYEDQLKERLPPWQKSIISYNLGTTLLKNGDADQAKKIFLGIPKDATFFSLLRPSYAWNLGVSYYQEARQLNAQPLKKEEEYLFVISQLQKANEWIQKSVQATCALDRLEGKQKCSIRPEAKEALTTMRFSLFQALKHYQHYRMNSLEPKDKILELLASVSHLKNAIQFMERFPEKNPLKQSYSLMFTQDFQSWLPVWENFPALQSQEFNQAKLKFAEALHAFKENDFASSQLLAEQTEEYLLYLNKENTQNQSFETLLNHLIAAHQKILAQDSLTSAHLILLQKQTTEALLQDSKEALKESLTLVQSALHALEESKSIAARIYLEASKRTLERLNFKSTTSPQDILDEAIQEQKYALNLNVLKGQSEQDHALDVLVHKAQDMVLQTALPYVEAVKTKQQELFSKRQQDQGIWKESLLSFNAGFQAAADARHIQLQNPEESLKKQQEALSYWEKTKQKAEAPETTEEPPQQASENKTQEPSSIEQTLQLLQEMEKDDQMPKKGQPLKEVKRPW